MSRRSLAKGREGVSLVVLESSNERWCKFGIYEIAFRRFLIKRREEESKWLSLGVAMKGTKPSSWEIFGKRKRDADGGEGSQSKVLTLLITATGTIQLSFLATTSRLEKILEKPSSV